MKKGIFPLSADPITIGHLEMMRSARKQCDELIVLIANNDEKSGSYTFTLTERCAMAKRAIQEYGLNGIRVMQTTGLMTDIFMREHCSMVFRGVRHVGDEVAEAELVALYSSIYPYIADKFIFLQTPEQFQHISSSQVKHFVRLGVDVSSYVPLFVKVALEQRINRQIKIGITGQLAVGKSFVATQLVEQLREHGHEAHHIVLDTLLHQFYNEVSPGAQAVREQLAEKFGAGMLTTDRRQVNRSQLAEKLFSAETDLNDIHWAQQLVYPHVERLYRDAIASKTGILLIEWAQLVEMNMLSWVNNTVIVVDSPAHDQLAQTRGLSEDYVQHITRWQWTVDRKQKAIQTDIDQQHYGYLFNYMNEPAHQGVDVLADQLLAVLQLF